MIFKIKKNNIKTPLQKGSTLIEALVSLIILSFGLLGIAGLLLASAGQQKNSQSYGVASILVNDITERMRANQADLSLTAPISNYTTPNVTTYAQAVANTINSQNNNSTACNTVGNTVDPNCTAPGAVAASDMQSWLGRINTELPGGAGRILQLNNDNITSRQVVIMWNDKATSQAESNSTTADSVNCPTGVIINGVTPVTVRCITVAFRP
jgi:type IV pilus assembly protein PilV